MAFGFLRALFVVMIRDCICDSFDKSDGCRIWWRIVVIELILLKLVLVNKSVIDCVAVLKWRGDIHGNFFVCKESNQKGYYIT